MLSETVDVVAQDSFGSAVSTTSKLALTSNTQK